MNTRLVICMYTYVLLYMHKPNKSDFAISISIYRGVVICWATQFSHPLVMLKLMFVDTVGYLFSILLMKLILSH